MPVVDVSADAPFETHVAAVREDAERCLVLLDEAESELSVALVDDAAMRKLNAGYRGKDRTTDVLAFAQREGEGAPDGDLLGDVVIAIPTAERQATERSHALAVEVRELLVHGILHLLGYDHERSPEEARRMFDRQREIMAALAG